jgi:hypothetical protein
VGFNVPGDWKNWSSEVNFPADTNAESRLLTLAELDAAIDANRADVGAAANSAAPVGLLALAEPDTALRVDRADFDVGHVGTLLVVIVANVGVNARRRGDQKLEEKNGGGNCLNHVEFGVDCLSMSKLTMVVE